MLVSHNGPLKDTPVARRAASGTAGRRLQPVQRPTDERPAYSAAVSSLRVRRGRDTAGVLRRTIIDVDGEPVVRVRRGETVEVDIGPGKHTVRARMDWLSSPTLRVDVAENETVTVQVFHPFSSIRKLFKNTDSAILISLVP